MAAWLSAGKDSTVISHESALEIHGLSDLIPRSIHLTVPRNRRGYRGMDGVTIHTTKQPIPETEIAVREGMRVTSPARSIVDAAEWGTSPEHVEAAVRDALRRGVTTRERLLARAKSCPRWVRELLQRSTEEAPRDAPRVDQIHVMLRAMETDRTVIQSDPEVMSGAPVFAGTRVLVQNLIDYLAAGDTIDDFLEDFPTVRREQAVATLDLVREVLTSGARPPR